MMIQRFLTRPSELVKRIRRSLRYWQGYGKGNKPEAGPVWRLFSFWDFKETKLTEPVQSNVSSYTLDEYVNLGRDKRYSESFRYIVVPAKLHISITEIKEKKHSEIKRICDLVCNEFVNYVGVSPSEKWNSEVLNSQIKPPKISYNYRKFNWDICKSEIFTQFDIFAVPNEELLKYAKIVQCNVFGYMPPRLVLDTGNLINIT